MPIVFVDAEQSKETDKKQKNKEKKQKKKARSGTNMRYRSSNPGLKPNPEPGRMIDMTQDEDWALCDKDCAWCGPCAEAFRSLLES
jgi:hypothetical protein